MLRSLKKDFSFRLLPLIILLISCCFLAALLSTIRRDVFFSGDAGLKYLIIKQIANTGEFKTLHTAQQEWVNEIWSQGYYPFKPPFVYHTGPERIISFPPFFQWLNAPLYKWFGYDGIYVISSISLLLLWICFAIILSRSAVKPLIVSVGLFLLAFCSPVTLYGATYWEHCTALLLSFANIIFLMRKTGSYFQAMATGVLSGFAVWLRPEAMICSGLFVCIVLQNYYIKKSVQNILFISSVLITISGFFVFNKLVYDNILGAHGLQVLNEHGLSNIVFDKLTILTHVNARFLLFFPPAIVFYVLAAWLFIKRPPWPVIIYQLTIIALVYALIAPIFLPNGGGKQWGPRYFLFLIPLMITVLCLSVRHVGALPVQKRAGIALLIVIIIYSVHLNTYQAIQTLGKDYAYRVTPGLQFLKKDTCDVIVVQNQFITQEFAALFLTKKFFLAEKREDFTDLCSRLQSAGVTGIIYIAVNNENTTFPGISDRRQKELKKIGGYFMMKYAL